MLESKKTVETFRTNDEKIELGKFDTVYTKGKRDRVKQKVIHLI